MLKRFLISLMAFVTVFMYQSQSWAAVSQADKVAETITIERNNILASDPAPFQIAKRAGGDINSMLWIASIFIPGLGQILMGDVGRGLKWLLLVYGVAILGTMIITIVGGALIVSTGGAIGPIISILGLVLWIVVIALEVWNILDAYNMSGENAGMSKLDSEKMASLEKQMKDAVNMVKNIKVSQNSVSVNAFAF